LPDCSFSLLQTVAFLDLSISMTLFLMEADEYKKHFVWRFFVVRVGLGLHFMLVVMDLCVTGSLLRGHGISTYFLFFFL
jgi:hypothetical protein